MATPTIPPVVSRRSLPKLSLRQKGYAALSKLFEKIIAASTALDAAVPPDAQPWLPNPDTATLQAAADAYNDALAAWPEDARGSADALTMLKRRRKEAEQLFRKYADYAASWARYEPTLIEAAGLEVKGAPTPPSITGKATQLKQLFVTGHKRTPIEGGFVGLRFKRGNYSKAFRIYQVDKEGNRILLDSGTRTRYVDLGGSFTPGERIQVLVESIGPEGGNALSDEFTLTAV